MAAGMSDLTTGQWRELNDRSIMSAVSWVRALLRERSNLQPQRTAPRRRGFGSCFSWPAPEKTIPSQVEEIESGTTAADARSKWQEANAELEKNGSESTLAQLARRFQLSPFEQNILLLCLAFELDTRVGYLCGLVQDRPHRPFPTFGLAMRLFDQPEWNALPPERPLRKYQLVEFRHPGGTPLVGAELRLDETVLHYLRGVPSLDARLTALASSLDDPVEPVAASQQPLVDWLSATLTDVDGSSLVVQLSGNAGEALRAANAAARQAGWRMYHTSLDALASATGLLDELTRLWQRDSALFRLALFVDVQDSSGANDPAAKARLVKFAAGVSSPIVLTVQERMPLWGIPQFFADVPSPTPREQHTAWLTVLPEALPDRDAVAGELSRQFCISTSEMHVAVASALSLQGQIAPQDFRAGLWRSCRECSRPRLDGLAQRIDVKATWDDLVLNEAAWRMLEQVRSQVKCRWRVYDDWGLAETMNRNLGISCLFAGESGTGKTMAAEVIANDLQLDLFRVDLSMVVNKYLGETEKHLRHLFDAVESCGAILFFDECDALFGKRSEVKDSHDRYANIEISYLLQRLESYRGLCILTTNNRGALDQSFLRRFRFIVTFPTPSLAERKLIWQKQLGAPASSSRAHIPTASLDYDRLARLPFTGGNIHSVILNAAFRAASRAAGISVTMRDVLAAARDELVKLERPIDESDFLFADFEAPETAA